MNTLDYLKSMNITLIEQKKLICDICNKIFSQSGSLNRHKKISHEKLKPFECEYCKKCFGYKASLKGHINDIHTKIDFFECEICNKKITNKSNIKPHLRMHLKELQKNNTNVGPSGDEVA